MFKLEEKLFLSKAIISNTHSLLLKSRFSDSKDNEGLVCESKNLALEMLKQRNELFDCSETKKTIKKEIAEVDFDEIINVFNTVCFVLPEVIKTTKERQNAILKILESYTTQDIGTVFKNVVLSDYLTGKKVEWKADFDWIMTPKNFIKILENKYKNIENGNRSNNTPATDAQHKQSAVSAVNAMFGIE